MGKISKVAEMMDDPESDGRIPKEKVNVLIVDDEELVADMHRDWVSDEGYSTEVAHGGEEGLRKLNANTDIVLLDRRMPHVTGDQFLEILRSDYAKVVDPDEFGDEKVIDEVGWDMDISPDTVRGLDPEIIEGIQDKDIDPLVCMVTAVYPSFKVVDMEFEHYLTKNVEKEEVLRAVEGLYLLGRLNEDAREYNALLRKKQILENWQSRSELRESEEYAEIQERMEELESNNVEVEELKEIEW